MAAQTKPEPIKEEPKPPKKLVVEEISETPETTKTPEPAKEEKVEEKEPVVEEVVQKESEEKEKEEPVKEEEGESAEENEDLENEELEGEEDEEKVSTKKVLLIAIPIAIFTGLLSGGIFYYVNSSRDSEEVAPTPTPIVEETASPTPAPVLGRSDLKVQVLNGSGTSGKAGVVETFLEDLGYEEVATGNADSYDFEETAVSIKKESEDYRDMIVEDLEEEYTVSSDTETLDEDSDFDVVITVGKS